MRIALVCDWFLPRSGGIELHLRDLARALAARGHEVVVFTTTPGPGDVDGVRVCRVPAAFLPWSHVAASSLSPKTLRRLLTSHRVDVVHAHVSVVSPTAFAGIRAAAELGLPAVATFHSMLFRAATVLGAAESLVGWSRNTVLTAVSSVVAAQLGSRMPEVDIGVLPNGVDVGFWGTERPRRESSTVRFVTALRLTRKKRVLRLLEAFRATVQFAANEPQLHLTVAGDGPDRPELERSAAELGIRDRVTFTGGVSREALRDLYASSDVFVLPSERESFGIAALEARCAGLPVVAMAATGVRDFIRSGTNGLLAQTERDLATSMQRIAVNAAFRHALAAHPGMLREYDWPAVAAEHKRFYEIAGTLRSDAFRTPHT